MPDFTTPKHLEVLLTCKQVYNEACALAFAATDFVVSSDDKRIEKRLVCLSAEQEATISRIFIVPSGRFPRASNMLKTLHQHGVRPSSYTIDWRGDRRICINFPDVFTSEAKITRSITYWGDQADARYPLESWTGRLTRAERNPSILEGVYRKVDGDDMKIVMDASISGKEERRELLEYADGF